jgi:hypothetical protein
VIGRLTEADKSIVRDRLATVGELMRRSDLEPDTEEASVAEERDLFAGEK